MGWLFLCVSAALTVWSASALSTSVFSSSPEAHMLLRSKRANSFLEELKPPSIERECVEERCDFEEAREFFITREATLEFWTVYTDGNQCIENPCVNGTCVDLYQSYACKCNPGFEGKLCDQTRTATNCSIANGDCDHECQESKDGLSRTCSCLQGHRLQKNSRQCLPIDDQSCGQLLVTKSSYSKPIQGLQPWLVGGEVGKKGESPWQALLMDARGKFHCGGVLIDKNWVLTAAHCLTNSLRFSVRLGDYERTHFEGTEVSLAVSKVFSHPNYNKETVDNDIALLRLSSPVPFSKYILPACLPGRALAEGVLHQNGTRTVVTGWGKQDQHSRGYTSALNFIEVPLVKRDLCARHMSNNVSANVLCAGVIGRREDACEGDSGGPMVTLYRNTWFLIGIVSWGEGCGNKDKLGIYTKVSNYNEWIDSVRQGWDTELST
ncbi:vitamin K-dependent protein C [Esox lucius]|uniref:Vitamin K-dependent protein C n=1 Tax=Esox lucius TaxID=8010 RepID=A0A3P9A7Z1_ESOLU|nr:vitamin K-dependent protein C [Esox lucius]